MRGGVSPDGKFDIGRKRKLRPMSGNATKGRAEDEREDFVEDSGGYGKTKTY